MRVSLMGIHDPPVLLSFVVRFNTIQTFVRFLYAAVIAHELQLGGHVRILVAVSASHFSELHNLCAIASSALASANSSA